MEKAKDDATARGMMKPFELEIFKARLSEGKPAVMMYQCNLVMKDMPFADGPPSSD